MNPNADFVLLTRSAEDLAAVRADHPVPYPTTALVIQVRTFAGDPVRIPPAEVDRLRRDRWQGVETIPAECLGKDRT